MFCHHGCCEHKLLIKDVRLPHATDVRARKHYPLMVLSGKWQMGTDRKCQVSQRSSSRVWGVLWPDHSAQRVEWPL